MGAETEQLRAQRDGESESLRAKGPPREKTHICGTRNIENRPSCRGKAPDHKKKIDMARNTAGGPFSVERGDDRRTMQAPRYALTRGSRTAPVTTTCADILTSAAPDWEPESLSYADSLKKCVRARRCASFFLSFLFFSSLLSRLQASAFSALAAQKPICSCVRRPRAAAVAVALSLFLAFFVSHFISVNATACMRCTGTQGQGIAYQSAGQRGPIARRGPLPLRDVGSLLP